MHYGGRRVAGFPPSRARINKTHGRQRSSIRVCAPTALPRVGSASRTTNVPLRCRPCEPKSLSEAETVQGGVRNVSGTVLRCVSLAALLLAIFGATGAGGATGITIAKSELNSSQLRVEGSGALPNHPVMINPGNVTGMTDANGAFKVQLTPYSSSTCRVTVGDGATSASTPLAGCTPTVQTAPAVSLSPASLTYASRDTATASAAQFVTVSNAGNAPLFFNSAAIGGLDTLDFTIVSDGCSGLTLAPGASCIMSVTFSPTAAGTRTAALTFTDNAPNSPQSASLTGTGTTPAGTTAPGVAIDTQFFTCSGSVCDIGAGSNVFVDNFFTTS